MSHSIPQPRQGRSSPAGTRVVSAWWRPSRLVTSLVTGLFLTTGSVVAAGASQNCQAPLGAKLLKAYIDSWYYQSLSDLDQRLSGLFRKKADTHDSPSNRRQASRHQVLTHADHNMAMASRQTLEQLGARPPENDPTPPSLQPYIPQTLHQARLKMRESGCAGNDSTRIDTSLLLDSNWHQYQALRAEIGDAFEPAYTDRTDSIMSLQARRERLEKQHELLMHASEILALTGQAERYAAALSGNGTGTAERTSKLTSNDAEAVMQALHQWIDDWSHRRISAYLAHYAPDFRPRRFHSRKTWARHRRRIISRSHNIRIGVEDPTLLKQGDAVSVEFTQHYRSDGYHDTTSKRVTFKNIGGTWKIVAESNR